VKKKNIKNYTLSDLEKIMLGMGQPVYRARQIFKWLFSRNAVDFRSMSDIPKSLVSELEELFYVPSLRCVEKNTSNDKTIKLLFSTDDGLLMETVIIPSRDRNTICLSTQVGCRFRCAFCASGMKGFVRNLCVSEILDQIIYVRDFLKVNITNYVFMGMGEPLDNYDNLVKVLTIMNDRSGFDIGARRITISTCGIVPAIKRSRKLDMQFNLSLSLHAVTDKKRNSIMPINKLFPLEVVVKELLRHSVETGRLITLEYILIPGFNDTPSDADELAKIARLVKAKINLIPYSEIPGLRFKAPDRRNIEIFLKNVKQRHEYITLRDSRGKDIDAACGQLALRRCGTN
jgi:23S rRNA (adenine2503-C2)-methyltransferase